MDLGMSGIGNYILSSNKNSTNALENKLNSVSVKDAEQTQEEAEAELLEACKQFEAYLWEQVLKGMEKTAKMFSDDEDEEGYAGNFGKPGRQFSCADAVRADEEDLQRRELLMR